MKGFGYMFEASDMGNVWSDIESRANRNCIAMPFFFSYRAILGEANHVATFLMPPDTVYRSL